MSEPLPKDLLKPMRLALGYGYRNGQTDFQKKCGYIGKDYYRNRERGLSAFTPDDLEMMVSRGVISRNGDWHLSLMAAIPRQFAQQPEPKTPDKEKEPPPMPASPALPNFPPELEEILDSGEIEGEALWNKLPVRTKARLLIWLLRQDIDLRPGRYVQLLIVTNLVVWFLVWAYLTVTDLLDSLSYLPQLLDLLK